MLLRSREKYKRITWLSISCYRKAGAGIHRRRVSSPMWPLTQGDDCWVSARHLQMASVWPRLPAGSSWPPEPAPREAGGGNCPLLTAEPETWAVSLSPCSLGGTETEPRAKEGQLDPILYGKKVNKCGTICF